MLLSGQSPDGRLVEIVELRTTHGSWPRSSTRSSRAGRSARIPLFDGFIKASLSERPARSSPATTTAKDTGTAAEPASPSEAVSA